MAQSAKLCAGRPTLRLHVRTCCHYVLQEAHDAGPVQVCVGPVINLGLITVVHKAVTTPACHTITQPQVHLGLAVVHKAPQVQGLQ
jgi:hypothetical protein